MRRVLAGTCLLVVVAGCGGDDGSLDEYVEGLNELVDRASREYQAVIAGPQGGVLVADRDQLGDFTPQDLQVALEQVGKIQAETLDAINAVEPPEEVADIHRLFFRELPFEELAARAGTAANWEELSDSPEMAAYRLGIANDKQLCTDFSAVLDAGSGFAIEAWLSAELQDIGEALLGCEGYPDEPENVYRPLPAATS